MVAEANEVIPVRKGDDSLRVDFRHWENVLENIGDSISKFGLEVVQDQVRVGLADWVNLVFQVVSQDHI